MLDSPLHQDALNINERNFKNELSDSSKSTTMKDSVNSLDDLTAAQNEWDAIHCIEPAMKIETKSSNGSPTKKMETFAEIPLSHHLPSSLSSTQASPTYPHPRHLKVTPHIDFDEVWEFFMRQDMSHVMASIKPSVERKGVNGFFHTLFGPKRLKQELISERNLLFAIAQCPLDNNEPLHIQILLTIYKVLTGTRFDCPRFGNHWDHVGFQGMDPATDLRGVGLLGLVQALYLVTTEEIVPLARDIYMLSHNPHSQFPLMVLAINVTRISLQALREGVLNKECNSRGNVRHVVNEYFSAVMFHIFWIWKTEKKTIKDSGFLIKDAEAYCKSNVRAVLQKLRVRLRRYSLVENCYPPGIND